MGKESRERVLGDDEAKAAWKSVAEAPVSR